MTWPAITIYEPPLIPLGGPCKPVEETPPPKEEICKHALCRKPFTPDHWLQVYCTKACYHAASRERDRLNARRDMVRRRMVRVLKKHGLAS